ncbi:hypothetical protein [Sphingomonas sp. PR090111-T3T-6A]|uniref:hypothetical protein n=1 Tax=Sphingomonas sp. PR090111-T3T-6A TaxID=685778 RepID=UPI00037FA4C1|nr:hypothetical protein [Sphingomonas sp. PR090111-T3T-6A]
MSHDQRPGRVRVFSSGSPAGTPQRRRTDPPPAPAAPPPAEVVSPAGPSLRTLAIRGALFLVACAAGGALAEAYHLPEMLVR